ncbi:MAG: glycerate kinase [Halothiobacillaceae bacterium]
MSTARTSGHRPLRVLVAPDSLKGSLTAGAAARAIGRGLQHGWPALDCDLVPLADGGEGTLAALSAAWNCQLQTEAVTGPEGNPVRARWGWQLDDRIAVIELAQASGFAQVTAGRVDPFAATTRGTGELIMAALARKPTRLVVTLGGSATNDGGLGVLHALGARLKDRAGEPVTPTLAGMEQLAQVDLSLARHRLAGIQVDLVADVRNPLLGPQGAIRTYGPQKGLEAGALDRAEAAMARYAERMASQVSAMPGMPGAGAAGGVGFALAALTGQKIQPGADFVLAASNVEQSMAEVDFIVTAEGALDRQTLDGKLVSALGERARKHNKPLYVLAGRVALEPEKLDNLGICAALSITPGPTSLAESMNQAEAWLESTAHMLARLMRSTCTSDRARRVP